MKPRLALLVGLSLIVSGGCEKNAPPNEGPRSAAGILVHHPPSVRSAEAWKGHQFLVDGVPVQPSEKVPESELLKRVGKRVSVTGRWNPGVVWNPKGEKTQTQAPVNPDPDSPMVRNDGIVIEAIRELSDK